MSKYDIGPTPAPISAEVIALLEQAETATIGHWRMWGFCDRRIQPLLRRRRVAGTAITLAIPGPDSTLLHHATTLLRPGDIPVLIGNANKLRAATGWLPQIPFEQTLQDLVNAQAD